MPSIASKNVTSPDLSVLGYSILYDISGATPTITITNHSTVTNPTQLKWWYAIVMPDGTYLHQGSLASPDVNHVAWSSIVVPDVWPTPFGTPPYAQIEFSCSVPYTFTLFVEDSTHAVFSLGTPTTLCRPNGSTSDTPGNFGKANVSIQTMFETAQIRGIDTTDYTYQNLLGTSQTNKWTLVYPFDNNNIRPSDRTAIDTASVLFPIGFTGDGYQIAFQSYSLYDMGNGSAIKIQYKFTKVFAVWLNVDLNVLRCEMDRLFRETIKSCGTVSNPDAINKLSQANYLYSKVLEGIIYPLNCVNVPSTIAEIQRLCGSNVNCFCSEGINAGVMPPASSGGTIQVPIYAYGTDAAPSNCPNSYFPVNVLNPAGDEMIGIAYSAEDIISIVNSSNDWLVYGIFFPQGNCLAGLYPLQLATTVPPIQVQYATPSEATYIGGMSRYVVAIESNCGTGLVPPDGFPITNATYDLGSGPFSMTTPINTLEDYIGELNTAMASQISGSATVANVAYPLSIVITSGNPSYTGLVTLGGCPTLTTPNLQVVTDGSSNNETTNDLIVYNGAQKTIVSSDNIMITKPGGSILAPAIQLLGGGSGRPSIQMRDAALNLLNLYFDALSSSQDIKFPDNTGTVALTSDIPPAGTLQTVTDGAGNNRTSNDLVVYGGFGDLQTATLGVGAMFISDAGGTQSIAKIFNSGNTGRIELSEASDITKTVGITSSPLTANREITTPDNDGMVALVSDIPVGLEGITTGSGNNITGHSLIVAISTQKTQQTSFSMDVYNAAGTSIIGRIFNSSGTGTLFLANSTGAVNIVPETGSGAFTLTAPLKNGTILVGRKGAATFVNGQVTILDANYTSSSFVDRMYTSFSGVFGTNYTVTGAAGGFQITSKDTSNNTVTGDNSSFIYTIIY